MEWVIWNGLFGIDYWNGVMGMALYDKAAGKWDKYKKLTLQSINHIC